MLNAITKALLTATSKNLNLFANGFDRPKYQGTEAMCRPAHGFFYPLPVMVGGVMGGLTACRGLGPVCQPVTSSAALSLTAPSGGLTPSKEPSMNTLFAGLALLRHHITLCLMPLRYQRIARAVLMGGVS